MTLPGQSVLIRADASPAIGIGHVMRCLAFSKAWQTIGGTATFLMAETLSALEQRLVREKLNLTKVSMNPASTEDAERTVREANCINATWVVVDGYQFKPDYIRHLQHSGLQVLFLDDDGRFDDYPADAILNQNISATPEMYAKRKAATHLLLGLEYALLRPEFLAEPRGREHRIIGQKVLVTTGGGDPDDVATKILLGLSKVDVDLEAKIVVGSGNPRYEQLKDLARGLSQLVQFDRNPSNMAQLMGWADVGISGAGGTSWELAYMGLPSLVIALSADQQGIASGLEARGIAVSLGWHANLSEEGIASALVSLLLDQRRRIEMTDRGQKLVDGQGAARVVKFLQSPYESCPSR